MKGALKGMKKAVPPKESRRGKNFREAQNIAIN